MKYAADFQCGGDFHKALQEVEVAIAELEGLRRKRDVDYAVLLALVAAHNRCKVVDYGALDALQAEISGAERDFFARAGSPNAPY